MKRRRMTEVHSKINAIISELEKASRMHAKQAEKLGLILSTLKKAKENKWAYWSQFILRFSQGKDTRVLLRTVCLA